MRVTEALNSSLREMEHGKTYGLKEVIACHDTILRTECEQCFLNTTPFMYNMVGMCLFAKILQKKFSSKAHFQLFSATLLNVSVSNDTDICNSLIFAQVIA